MALTKPYFWVYDPSYYSTKQLHLFTNLLKNDVDITRLEKDKVSVRQLEALLVASNKNFDVALECRKAINVDKLPIRFGSMHQKFSRFGL